MSGRAFTLALVVGLLGCGGPFVVFPGGALSGPVVPVPESFAFAEDAGTIQLETRPADPYSVNIAGIVIDGRLFINAGDTRTTWVEHMEADPRVRTRIDGQIYELRAERVTDSAEMKAFAQAWVDRVTFGRDPTKLDVAYVYELKRR